MKAIPKEKSEYLKFERTLLLFCERERNILESAYRIAKREHRGQKKFGIYPYIIHTLAVFDFLVRELGVKDADILSAALLHDTVEDGKLGYTEIEKKFGKKIANIVKAVSREAEPDENERQKAARKLKHFERYIINGTYEVQMLGIADKCDNIANVHLISPGNPNYKKRERWIREAKRFLPIAKKISKHAHLILRSEIERSQTFLKHEHQ